MSSPKETMLLGPTVQINLLHGTDAHLSLQTDSSKPCSSLWPFHLMCK